ncbi:hypothetical protein MATR_32900 [Marivirga tractuosa]|uniref:Uncharacterized protein n=1 Tax=Marivirga tractuosa (strain ATCC 23168 / DSM 4126 / NBRC 15989 / NCIMB 1408 / VKM B-1430 / H-43) TaxID=643867 RepID=E4TSE6_MARTH|nr:hypothetical protein Ftrac_2886 [Marivirga tractuosa DSM 4126]BDD16465.1 hypothetical protein MATR_32900 [Marivirga tractuosa]
MIFLFCTVLSVTTYCEELKFAITNQQNMLIAGGEMDFEVVSTDANTIPSIYVEIVDAADNRLQAEAFLVEETPYQNTITLSSNLKSGKYLLNVFNLEDNSIISSEAITIINLREFSLKNVQGSKELDLTEHSGSIHSNFSFKQNLKGIVRSAGEPQKSISVFMQCNGDDNLFRISKTDENGLFEFKPTIFGTNEVYFDQLDGKLENISIEIINNDYEKLLSVKDIEPSPFHSKKLTEIDSVTIKNLVKNYADNLTGGQDRKNLGKDFIIDESIVAADYFTLASTEEFISELVPYKKIKNKKNDTRLYLLNKFTSSYFKNEPLFIIDGFIVPDFETILDIKIENLESIDVSYSSQDNLQFFGELAFYGVIQLNTKEGTFRPESGKLIKVKGFNQ